MKNYRIAGRVVDRKTRMGLPGLLVQAVGRGVNSEAPLAEAKTDGDGAFLFEISAERFKAYFINREPELFFTVFRAELLLASTEETERWSLKSGPAKITIEVDAGPRRASDPGKLLLFGHMRYASRAAIGDTLRLRVVQSKLGGDEIVHEEQLAVEDEFQLTIDPPGGQAPLKLLVLSDREGRKKPLFVSKGFPPVVGKRRIDLTIADPAASDPRFSRLVAAILPNLDGLSIADLDDEQWSVLTERADLAHNDAAHLRRAVALVIRLASYQGPGAMAFLPIFFLFTRNNAAPNLSSIMVSNDTVQKQQIDDAVRAGDIDPSPWRFTDGGKKWTLSAQDFFALKTSSTGNKILFDLSATDGDLHAQVAAVALKSMAKRRKLRELFGEARDAIRFLKLVDTSNNFTTKEKKQIRLATGLYALTERQPRLVDALLKAAPTGKMRHAAEIATFEPVELAKIIEVGGGAPLRYQDYDNPELAFAEVLLDEIHRKAPTRAFLVGLNKVAPKSTEIGRVSKLLEKHPAFDLFSRPARAYFRSSETRGDKNDKRVSVSAEEFALIERTQRVARLAPLRQSAIVATGLFKAGIGSAHEIARMGEERFQEKAAKHFVAEITDEVFQTAARINQVTTALVTDIRQQWQFHTRSLLPKTLAAASPFQTDDGASLETLFGSLDSCACRHCRSVYSPGAYLASLLNWLDVEFKSADGTGNVTSGYEALQERRGDIPLIELDCENAETLLPHIDLVLEILEHIVAKDDNDLSAMEHQTDWETPDLLVDGEHFGPLKQRAYDRKHLLGSFYPWTLPFNLWLELTRTYLQGMGVKRHQILSLAKSLPAGTQTTETAAEILNLSQEQFAVIAKSSGTSTEACWGLSYQTFDQFVQSASVKDWMTQSGLSYEDLLELLRTEYISKQSSPPGRVVGVIFSNGDNCDLSRASFTNIDLEIAADRLHRFKRLQNGLGWTSWEIDEVITAFGNSSQVDPLDETLLFDLARLEKLRTRTGLPLTDLIGWFGQIPAYDGKDASKWYRDVFLQKSGKGGIAEIFALASIGSGSGQRELAEAIDLVNGSPDEIAQRIDLLRDTLGLNQADFDSSKQWINDGAASPSSTSSAGTMAASLTIADGYNLADLSAFFRLGSVAGYLGLSVAELRGLFDFVDADPFNWTAEDASRFLDFFAWSSDLNLSATQLRLLLGEGSSLVSDTQADEIATSTQGEFIAILTAQLPTLLEPLVTEDNEADYSDAIDAYLSPEYAHYLDLVVRGKPDSELQLAQPQSGPADFARGAFAELVLPDHPLVGPVLTVLPDALLANQGYFDEDNPPATVPDSFPHTTVRTEIIRRLFIFLPETASKIEALFEQVLGQFGFTALQVSTIRAVVKGKRSRFPKFMPDGSTVFDAAQYLNDLLPDQSPFGIDLAAAVSEPSYPRQLRSDEFAAYTELEVKAEIVQRCASLVFDEKREEIQTALEEALVASHAKGLGISIKMSRTVLRGLRANWLPGAPPDALQFLTPVAELSFDPAAPPSLAGNHTEVLRHVALVASRLEALGLADEDETDLLYYWQYSTLGPGVDPVDTELYWFDPFDASAGSSISPAEGARRWQNLTRGLSLRISLGLGISRLVDNLNEARDSATPLAKLEAVKELLASRPAAPEEEQTSEILAVLEHLTSTNSAAALENSIAELTLAAIDNLEVFARLGITQAQALDFSKYPTDAGLPGRVRTAWRNRTDDVEGWLGEIREIHDRMRELRRDRLVDFLIGRYDKLRDVADIYTHFLIDTEMAACAQTSRIVAATQSVQLFIIRIFMGLEEDVYPRNAKRAESEWEWRKNYRVWEAARKVFLYPENWIQASLRLDKTPFFEELEEELSQNEMNNLGVEEALVNYLRKVDEVAKLDIRGFCYEADTLNAAFNPNRDALEVFGCTTALPNRYFHRTRKPGGGWSAWREIEHDIEGDHLIPVYWNRSLHLFWPTFVNKQQDKVDYLELSFNFSRFQSGRWRKKERLPTTIQSGPYSGVGVFDKLGKKIDSAKKLKLSAIDAKIATLDPLGFLFWVHPAGSRPQDLRIRTRRTFPHIGLWTYDKLAYEDGIRLSASYHAQLEPDYDPDFEPNPTYKYVHYRPDRTLPIGMKLQNGNDILYTKENVVIYDPQQTALLEKVNGYELVFAQQNRHHLYKDPFFFEDSNRSYFVHHIGGTKKIPDGAPPYDYNDGYLFENFKIAGAQSFISRMNSGGLDDLLAPPKNDPLYLQQENFGLSDFGLHYRRTAEVTTPLPNENIDFTYGSPTSQYYWEIFFHIPTLLAERYRSEGQFEEALKCLRYVFDPSDLPDNPQETGFWRFQPFYGQNSTQSMRYVMNVLGGAAPYDEEAVKNALGQIAKWRSDPFDPHGIAAMRPLAYMLWIFTSYVEILIEWADALFTQDTRESINEAVQLYTIAAQMLGRKPETIERQGVKSRNFAELRDIGLDSFSNAAIEVESVLPITILSGGASRQKRAAAIGPQPTESLYFCIPDNPQLLALWDTVADRLFKIRHCMNIKGTVRSLALFQPPIDPGLLVRARAAGLDLGDVVSGLNVSPHYRFGVLLQKASEFSGQVQSLGNALRSAKEQRDGETMAQLRSQQETSLQMAMRGVRDRQHQEAKQQLKSLRESRKITEVRLQNNQKREYRIKEEVDANKFRKKSEDWMMAQRGAQMLGAFLTMLPDAYVGLAAVVKAPGGDKFGNAAQLTGMAMSGVAEAFRNKSVEAADNASVKRRWQGWRDEARVIDAELKNIDQQIIGAEIRVAIAEQETANTDLQIEHSRETLEFMKTKYSNEALYDWMANRLSRLHRESYELANNLARQAQKAFEFEIGTPENPIVNGHWQPGKGGLLAAESLSLDLRRLDAEYMERNERRYELRRDISLRLLDANALMELTVTGACEFELPEWLFQMDCPGVYKRRIKMMALSIPAVAGRYSPLHCKLTLLNHQIRETPDLTVQPERRYDALSSIVTSTGLNDTGLFEPNLQDPRYLPFEGCGVVARFRLELLNEAEIDVTTISDALLHLQYTALEGGDGFRLAEAAVEIEKPDLLFSMRHEFADEWHLLLASAPSQLDLTTDFPVIPLERLPYRARGAHQADDYQAPVGAWALVQDDVTKTYDLVDLGQDLSGLAVVGGKMEYTGVSGTIASVVDVLLVFRADA